MPAWPPARTRGPLHWTDVVRLVGIPIEGQQDCEWRLAELIGQTITDGLGMIPQEAPVGALAHGN